MGDGKKFLRTRAPFYMAGAALLLVFVVPEITKSGLEDVIPYDALGQEEARVLEEALSYTGPNDTGISLQDAVSERIKEEHSGGNVFDHRSTALEAAVEDLGGGAHRITLDFESRDGELFFDFNMNANDGVVTGNNNLSKDVVDLVYYYD